ncbi:olfactory receptor 5V1-like [Rhinatrema bivittatum]|uniref:olfactory receptor 5V1-like n=1 Tax=Rhinatrema bivittatum TaxID=194408 RepID=UPI0011278DB6|nr:olfactory receptor 5V1-like [Rhinatrema bivittatum]
MEPDNYTAAVKDFTLLGFPDRQIALSFLFLLLYVLILAGNLAIFTVIRSNPHLHKPMYFFLSNLSLLDICYSSTTLPSMLANSVSRNTVISFHQCLVQLYFFVSLGGAECLLLAIMAYDRYIAICNPLRYPTVMNQRACWQLAAGSWLGGFLNSVLHTLMTSNLPFCMDRKINHYFCDVPPLLRLACTNTYTSKTLLYVVSVFLGMSPFVFVVISYIRIISTILKIRSAEGRRKAFSTCSSHLIVVTVFYVTANFNYIGPGPGDSFDLVRLSSMLYSGLTPLLNPVIYCLRNKEVKAALTKALQKRNVTPKQWPMVFNL